MKPTDKKIIVDYAKAVFKVEAMSTKAFWTEENRENLPDHKVNATLKRQLEAQDRLQKEAQVLYKTKVKAIVSEEAYELLEATLYSLLENQKGNELRHVCAESIFYDNDQKDWFLNGQGWDGDL